MEVYQDNNHNSGVARYQLGETFITIEFKKAVKTYTYSYRTAGEAVIEQMKQLAVFGSGLGTYINKNRPQFE